MTFSAEQIELLKAPLNMANVKPAKSFGPKGDYIEGWHAMAEANRIFGFHGWDYEVPAVSCVHQGPREIGKEKKPGHGVTYTAKVAVRVGETVREDFGAGHGYDVDLGLAHESALKEAVTDALKRALRSFGSQFGLALYDKSRANVTDDPVNDDEAQAVKQFIAMIETLVEQQTVIADLDELHAKNVEELKRRLKPDDFNPLMRKFAARRNHLMELA